MQRALESPAGKPQPLGSRLWTGDQADFDDAVVQDFTRDMGPGTTAIIVEADEANMRPVDDIVALGHGHVYRQAA